MRQGLFYLDLVRLWLRRKGTLAILALVGLLPAALRYRILYVNYAFLGFAKWTFGCHYYPTCDTITFAVPFRSNGLVSSISHGTISMHSPINNITYLFKPSSIHSLIYAPMYWCGCVVMLLEDK